MHITANKWSTRQLTQVGIFVAVIAICAQIAIPGPGGVPFSLQAWSVALAGVVLGAKMGFVAALVYGLLGMAGAPVFVGFAGGLQMFMSPTAGFIFSFPLLAFLAGLGAEKNKGIWLYLGMIMGVGINFMTGVFYFSWITSMSLPVSVGFAVTPFIVPTLAQIVLVPLFGKTLRSSLSKAGLLVQVDHVPN